MEGRRKRRSKRAGISSAVDAALLFIFDRVDKLPADFPIDRWDDMTTKEQLNAMKYSGLSMSDQWPLLNTAISLQAFSLMNAALKGQGAERSPLSRSISSSGCI